MRMKIGALAAVAGVALGLGTLSSTSRAAIVETIIDTDADAAVGSITFPALTGDSDAGLLFSYGGLTQADVTLNLSPTLATQGSFRCSDSGKESVCQGTSQLADIGFVLAPEPSTWAMMVVGFVGLGLAGYRSNRLGARQNDSVRLGASEKIAT